MSLGTPKILQLVDDFRRKRTSQPLFCDGALKKVKTLKPAFTKLEKLQAKLDGGKLSEKMQVKTADQLHKQLKNVESSITGLNLTMDEMDGLIEKIYGIASEYREAGKQEKIIEKHQK